MMLPDYVPVHWKVVRQATSSTPFSARTPRMKPGGVFVVDNISVGNNASNNIYLHVGFINGNTVSYLDTIKMLSDGYYYAIYPHVVVPSDWQVYFYVHNPNDEDIYKINVFGRLFMPE